MKIHYKMINKLISLVLCLGLSAAAVTGCGSAAVRETTAESTIAVETTESETSSETTPATVPEKWFTYKTKVYSSFHERVFGKQMCDAWYSLVDAVMAGEDSFSCPNGHIYLWTMAEFPKVCFPVIGEIVKPKDHYDLASINGTAEFDYKVSKEEAAKKIAEFEELAEDIINEVIRPEYTDFEKALALYSYFTHTYTYDYDTFRKVESNEAVNYTSSYRLLTTKTGICCEIAEAYSYLLLQVGVDAATVINAKHEWSIIKLNDKNYHIDPTFGLSDWDNLSYFLMNDEQRIYTDLYNDKTFQYVAYYDPEVPPDFSASDDTYKVLWDYHMTYFDPTEKKIECWKYKEDGTENFTYDYSGSV